MALALGAAAPSFASDGDEGSALTSAVLSSVASGTEAAPGSMIESAPPAADEEPAVPVEGTGLEELSQIVTAVEEDDGNVNVSVRVLSPGSDENLSQDEPAPGLISPEQEPDITAVPDTPVEESETSPSAVNTNVEIRVLSPGDNGPVDQTHEAADDTLEDGDAPVEAASEDVGSSVVSSTGTAGGPTSAPDPDALPATTPDDSDLPLAVAEDNSVGYQEEDSQYQSEPDPSQDPWYWSWWLTIDCAGNATSSSTETGSPSSLDWTWEWMWDWSCADADTSSSGSTEASPSATTDVSPSGSSETELGSPSPSSTSSGSGNTNVSVRVLSPGDNGPVTQTASSSTATEGDSTGTQTAGGPWNWNWTFTFCGETTSLATEIESQTPLSWTWDWTWNWTCDAAVGPPPDLADTAQPGTVSTPTTAPTEVIPTEPEPSSAMVSPVSEPTVEVPPLPQLTSVAGPGVPKVDVTVAVVLEPEVALPVLPPELSVSLPTQPGGVDVSIVVLPGSASTTTALPAAQESPPLGTPTGRDRGEPRRPAAPARGAPSSAAVTRPTTTTWQPPAGPEGRASSKPAARQHSARPAPPRRARGSLSLFGEPRTSQAAGQGTSGGLVPSAPVVAVAALTAFFLLVAPRVGRRIRVARELSPRGTYRSSIDHPG